MIKVKYYFTFFSIIGNTECCRNVPLMLITFLYKCSKFTFFLNMAFRLTYWKLFVFKIETFRYIYLIVRQLKMKFWWFFFLGQCFQYSNYIRGDMLQHGYSYSYLTHILSISPSFKYIYVLKLVMNGHFISSGKCWFVPKRLNWNFYL